MQALFPLLFRCFDNFTATKFYDSRALIPLETRNFMQTRCLNFLHDKNGQTKFSSPTIQKLSESSKNYEHSKKNLGTYMRYFNWWSNHVNGDNFKNYYSSMKSILPLTNCSNCATVCGNEPNSISIVTHECRLRYLTRISMLITHFNNRKYGKECTK